MQSDFERAYHFKRAVARPIRAAILVEALEKGQTCGSSHLRVDDEAAQEAEEEELSRTVCLSNVGASLQIDGGLDEEKIKSRLAKALHDEDQMDEGWVVVGGGEPALLDFTWSARAAMQPEFLLLFADGEQAEKAATALNEDWDWRNGLRARLLRPPKRKAKQPKPAAAATAVAAEEAGAAAEAAPKKKAEGVEEAAAAEETTRGSRKRGLAKLKELRAAAAEAAPQGPRGPDGTRGFHAGGRGKRRPEPSIADGDAV